MSSDDPIRPDLTGQRIGFIGLGNMGWPMVQKLVAAGAQIMTSLNRPRPVPDSVTVVDSPAHLAGSGCAVIIVMVTDTPAMQRVVLGDGLLSALPPGTLVIDMGTSAVAATRDVADQVQQAGGAWLDAPVSGGVVAAEAGGLTIMAGGSAAAFAQALPIFQVLGRRVTHVGAAGAGQVAKTCNQVIVGLTINAVAEALALAHAAGVDPALVRDAIRGGFAESRVLDLHGGRMVSGALAPGARATIQRKDLAQALDLAELCDIALPATSLCRDQYDRLIAQGDGDLDHAALIRLWS